MGNGKAIQSFALISVVALLTACASNKKAGRLSGAEQPASDGTKWGYYTGKRVKFEGQMVARAEQIPRAIPVNPVQIDEARDWIRRAEPSLEQIEQRDQAEAW